MEVKCVRCGEFKEIDKCEKCISRWKFKPIQDGLVIIALIIMAMLVFKLATNIDAVKNDPCQVCEDKFGYSCINIEKYYSYWVDDKMRGDYDVEAVDENKE